MRQMCRARAAEGGFASAAVSNTFEIESRKGLGG
jgi:hypothetical protein